MRLPFSNTATVEAQKSEPNFENASNSRKHAGAIFGYSTWMLHHPGRGATVIVLANRGETMPEFANSITFRILDTLFP